MTISHPAELLGKQEPRLSSVPSGPSSGPEAVELAGLAGLILDPWQRQVLEAGLNERADGSWAAFEVGLVVPRQNGKGSVLEALELAHLFLFGSRLVLHSAHEFKTAKEAYLRIKSLIEDMPSLAAKVAYFHQSNEDTSIGLKSGQRLRFVARSTGSGRGFSGDCVILDEAFALTDDHMAALLPTLSARPNPQVWYTSTPPKITEGHVLRRLRERALSGEAARLAYMEWSAQPDESGSVDLDSRSQWATANPALGLRIPAEIVEAERAAMTDEDFSRERLGLWAAKDMSDALPGWAAQVDPGSGPDGPVALAFDVAPDRSRASIAAAGRRPDGALHVELIESQAGTRWLPARVAQIVAEHSPLAVWVNAGSAAAAL